MTNEQLWQAILGELELTLSKANFTTWFKSTFIISQEANCIIVGVPNGFTKTWLENKYQNEIITALKHITNNTINQVFYKVEINNKPTNLANLKEKINNINHNSNTEEKEENYPKNQFGLNPKYTFDKFIVGKNNELAHAAAKAVSKAPGNAYNPLYIYGQAGLGKTHLLQAIGHEILNNKPNTKLLYLTCEKFTNEFINTLRTNRANEFQQKYRNIDVLIIDDIQFIAGKEQTQEQFFHTFNDLYQKDKQLIISSDRPPKAIQNLEQRLQSRFEWGMTADISAPDYETRVAILEQKAIDKNFSLEKNIINYLAENIQSNIRELEGALNHLYARFQLNNHKLTLDEVKSILQSINTIIPKSALSNKSIIQTVSEFFNISTAEIVGTSRKKELVVPRQIAMYLMREELETSFIKIGHELGDRDHTTAIHAYTKIKEELNNDGKIKQNILLIKQKLYNK
ncbi:MAG TPA: chromosomal replication initiator protein DnaA [bacterium]|nr:chromosomal replication initiator protein DnaA [bacterium]